MNEFIFEENIFFDAIAQFKIIDFHKIKRDNPVLLGQIIPKDYSLELEDEVGNFLKKNIQEILSFQDSMRQNLYLDTIQKSKKIYLVKQGDVLGQIAIDNNVSVKEIMSWNNLKNTIIYQDQKLILMSKHELNNNKLRIEGEQKAQDTKINIEKQALAEEVAAFERQDERDVQKMNRLAGLQDRAMQNQMMYQQAAQEQSMQAMGAVTDLGTSMMSMAGGMPGGGGGGVPGVAPPTGGGLYGYGDAPAGTTSVMTDQGAMSMAPSDRRLKKNIKYIGNSDSGLKIYTFEYIDKKGVYKGVMSDEIPSNAITKDVNGYDLVDYSKIDVEFEKIK